MERWNIGPVDPFVLSTKHNQYRHRRTLRTHSKGTTSTKENDGTLWIYGYFNVLCCITYFAPHPPDSVPNANKTRSAACCRKPTHTSPFPSYFNASPPQCAWFHLNWTCGVPEQGRAGCIHLHLRSMIVQGQTSYESPVSSCRRPSGHPRSRPSLDSRRNGTKSPNKRAPTDRHRPLAGTNVIRCFPRGLKCVNHCYSTVASLHTIILFHWPSLPAILNPRFTFLISH